MSLFLIGFAYAGTTELVSVSSTGEAGNGHTYNRTPAISDDGRYIAFVSSASNLVENDTNNLRDVFVHDRVTQTTKRINIRSTGEQTVLYIHI